MQCSSGGRVTRWAVRSDTRPAAWCSSASRLRSAMMTLQTGGHRDVLGQRRGVDDTRASRRCSVRFASPSYREACLHTRATGRSPQRETDPGGLARATTPGMFGSCVTTPRGPTSFITCACPAASRSSGTTGPAGTGAPDAPSPCSVLAMTLPHHGAETPRRGPSWLRCWTPDCVTRAANPAAAARNSSSVPVPEPSCEHVESQQYEPGLPSPTCSDAQIHRRPHDLTLR
ncbi:hypothetical protein QFZ22_009569 [Streptomyces canus]|uniref:Uncharacterized protein n=1 Tax=Streptomyces canus TaxID=58343 RepID=A0AAW8FUM4_9ACTN|nr:hypothetical protein [Streptomyces canus]